MVKMSLAKQVKYNNKIIPSMEVFDVNDEDVAAVQKLGGFIHPEEVVEKPVVKTRAPKAVVAKPDTIVASEVVETPVEGVIAEPVTPNIAEVVAPVEPVVEPVEEPIVVKPVVRGIQTTLSRAK